MARKAVARESKGARRERAALIFEFLQKEYPEAATALDHRSPFELAVATILSAQCTDARVNLVTPELFERFPGPEELARADQNILEVVIHSTGFFRNKAKNLIGMAQGLVGDHGGDLPRTLAELTRLPGIGRKTGNVILGNAFGIDEGVVVDTHVKRISGRLGLTLETNPDKIEQDLLTIIPRKDWLDFNYILVNHGRAICQARKPKCTECPVKHLCPSI